MLNKINSIKHGLCRKLMLATALMLGIFAFTTLTNATTHSAPSFPGKKTNFRGYDRYSFMIDNSQVLIITPKKAAPGNPWIWRGSFWGNKVYPFTELTVIADLKLVDQGFYLVVAGPNVQLGHPSGNKHLDAVYEELTKTYHFAKKPALVGLSREGLSIYRWASANPEKVSCIYLDNGVCDFKSWPGGKGVGKGDAKQWALLLKLYDFKSEEAALAYDKNPIDLLKPLAVAHVPLLHVCGAADHTVPYEENSAIIKKRYEQLGGKIDVILKPGMAHHPHGLEDPTPIVDFISENSLASKQTL